MRHTVLLVPRLHSWPEFISSQVFSFSQRRENTAWSFIPAQLLLPSEQTRLQRRTKAGGAVYFLSQGTGESLVIEQEMDSQLLGTF